jgi:Predicted integral membrane protein (DUF2269)
MEPSADRQRGLNGHRLWVDHCGYASPVPSLASWLKFAHVVVAFAFVAGLIGRGIVLRQAARSSDIATVSLLTSLAGRFENALVIPGSTAVLPAGLLTMWAEHMPFVAHGSYWLVTSVVVYAGLIALVPTIFLPRGRAFGVALVSAQERGTVTPDLKAAFHDPAVAFARNAELLGVAFILAMMVLKPF